MVLVSKLLASLIVGLAITPLLFIAQGVLGGFGWQFSAVSLPFLAVSLFYLFASCILNRPVLKARWLGGGVSMLSWLVVVLFVAMASSVNLMTVPGQIAISSLTCIVGTALAFCCSFAFPTPLEVKLREKSQLIVTMSFFIPVSGMTLGVLAWWLSEPSFI